MLTYLKLQHRALGPLINFNVPTLKDGVRRIVAGDLFKHEKRTGGDIAQLLLLLCASVSLWFKAKFLT